MEAAATTTEAVAPDRVGAPAAEAAPRVFKICLPDALAEIFTTILEYLDLEALGRSVPPLTLSHDKSASPFFHTAHQNNLFLDHLFVFEEQFRSNMRFFSTRFHTEFRWRPIFGSKKCGDANESLSQS